MIKRERRINSQIIEGGLRKNIWKLALPMMAGAGLQNIFSLVDLFFIGKLGHIAIAALSIAGAVMAVILMLIIGIATGTTALVAHFIGKQDYENADNTAFQTLLLGIIGSIFILFIGLFGITPLLKLFGAEGEILSLATIYLKITFLYSIFIFLFVGLNQALRGAGDTITPLKILVIVNIINIILDPMLIFGFGPFPRMGIAGSAAATVFSRAIGTFFLFYHLLFRPSVIQFHRGIFKVDFPLMKKIAKIGIFASLQVFLRQVSFLLLIRLVASFGATSLAAYGIGSRLRMLAMMPGFGLASAGAIMVGQNMGAGFPERARVSGWEVVKAYQTIALPMSFLFILFAPFLISVFSQQAEVIHIGVIFLRFSFAAFPCVAVSIVLGRSMNGAGDTFAPAIITGIAKLLFCIPLAYLLSLYFHLNQNGIWLGMSISDVFQSLLFIWYFKKGLWQKRYYEHRESLEKDIFERETNL